MNGESKKSFALALASFAIGAVVVAVFGNPTTRAKISESGKNLVKRTKKLGKRTDLA
jgi:membrane protein implicated in regulation of membrane protease activity